MRSPRVLLDQPMDGAAEERGWVEKTVSEGEARDLLTPWCFDENGREDARPTGDATTRWLRPEGDGDLEDEATDWVPCACGDPGAVVFWEIDTTETSPASRAEDERE